MEKRKKSISKLMNYYFDDIAKEVTYKLKASKISICRQNLNYVSPYFYGQYQNDSVIWHKLIRFDEYKRLFKPTIDDNLTAADEFVLVMVLDAA